MAKKKSKNKKQSGKIKKVIEESVEVENDKSSITARLEKVKSVDVFEGMTPEKHVDQLKEQVMSAASQQARSINESSRGFPWTEFLIGFILGGALLIVMFVFHINFAKNVNKRIVNLENRVAMLSPEITSPDREYLQILSQQQMFASEINAFKRKLQNFPSSFMMGSDSFEFTPGKVVQGKVHFTKKFRKKPTIIYQASHREFECKIDIDDKFHYFTYEISSAKVTKGIYNFFWVAGIQK
ncbi:hypothetical protein [Candidatus Uabimicrobium sp. HlEnr_7]|uniref:hypothetical protein n=1 Tax=Candidatus Uabimicrobium helgolandensis TaxID=3095367 RepID=UPI0035575CF7